MITNFVTDDLLLAINPDITQHFSADQTDHSEVINTAYENVIDDIENRGLDARKCHVPIDLNKLSTDTAFQYLRPLTKTATYEGEIFEGKRERRLVINVTSKTASTAWTFTLQGSNEVDEPEASSSYWETVTTIISYTTDTTGEKTVKFTKKYKWYRLRAVPTGSTSITFTAALYETIWDFVIAYKAMQLIYAYWMKEENDIWDNRRKVAMEEYEKLMSVVKANYDLDDSGGYDSDEGSIDMPGSITSSPIQA